MHISLRILASVFAVLAAVLVATGWTSITDERQALERMFLKRGNTVAQSLAAFSIEALVAQDYPALEHALRTIGQGADNIQYIEVTRQGRTVARFGQESGEGHGFNANVVLLEAAGRGRTLGQVRVVMSTRDHEAIVTARMWDLVANLVMVFLALAFTLRLLLRRMILKRVEDLTRQTERLIAEELPGVALLPIERGRRPDEITRLRMRFDHLLDGLKAREQDRDRAMAQLEETRALLEEVSHSLPSALVVVSQDGRVEQCNRAALAMTGHTPEQAIGQAFDRVCPQLAGSGETIRAALMERRPLERYKMADLSGARSRLLDIAVYPLARRKAGGAVIRIDDITERARMEELMVQSEKLVSIGGLAAGIAHEINNPLGVIMQAAQNIERRVSDTLPANHQAAAESGTTVAALRDYLARRGILQFLLDIREDSARAARIVRSLLEFSRKGEGGMEHVNLAELVERTLEHARKDYDLKKKYDFRKIAVIRDLPADLPALPMIRGEMEQVLLNLLKNSAQAMLGREDGAAAPPRIDLRARRDGDAVEITLEDNGPGFTEEARRRAFEPFYTTKPTGVGTGLGLWVAYRIVTEKHHGRIQLVSAPGEGARFILRLPLVEARP